MQQSGLQTDDSLLRRTANVELLASLASKVRFHLCVHIRGTQLQRRDFDPHFLDLAGELVVPFLVVVGHGRLAVQADVRAFVGREDIGLRAVDLSFGNFLAVDEDRARAALAQARPS